ncbi:MAG TPA: hypothetical protein VF959_00910 [Casimicrobiaceae bacterium]
MTEKQQVTPATDPVHLSFSEQRQPTLRGAGRRYMLARGDQLAFAAEVVRFGFAPDDFALDVNGIRRSQSASSASPTFTVTVKNLRNGHSATYLGGPGRTWVAEFLIALISGEFGQA